MTSVDHVVCDLAFHFLEAVVVSNVDPPAAPESTMLFLHVAQSHAPAPAPAPLHAAQAHAPESSYLCLPIQHLTYTGQ
jgi:hypothetical protein